jgi:hypothetical protein
MSYVSKELFNKEFLNKWFNNYNKLKSFYQQTGSLTDVVDEELARWVEVQRSIKHMLPKKLIDKLKEIDFDFENKDISWEAMYRQLASFIHKNGYSYLYAHPQEEALKDWVIRQIQNKRFLSENQLQRLDNLCINWHIPMSRDQKWELLYLRLKNFQQTFGHCKVPRKWANDMQLSNWLTVNRRMYARNKLRIDRQRKLDELGFVWNVKTKYDAQWEQFFQELAEFHRAYGHCRVPGTYEKLVSWIERQRILKTNNQLLAERERRLNGLNFIWSFKGVKDRIWEERYKQLQEYTQKNGHCFVPVNFRENKKLGIWVATQRQMEAKGKLGYEKKKKLIQIGFVWRKDTKSQIKSMYDSRWEVNFEKLKTYKQMYGTCQVSVKKDQKLQRWTRWQRIVFYQGKLSKGRIDKLNQIRFPWSTEESYWMKMYDELTSFNNQFGHTRVPYGWAPNPQLAAWVYRVKLTKSNLTPQKIELLKLIHFDWTLNRKILLPWKVMYDRLIQFKQMHGHTYVPAKWHKDPKLGKWVSRMRHEREKLTVERIVLLEAIEFNWCCKRTIITEANSDSKQQFISISINTV